MNFNKLKSELEKIQSGKESDFRFIQLEINALENYFCGKANDLLKTLNKELGALEDELQSSVSATSNAQRHLNHIADLINKSPI